MLWHVEGQINDGAMRHPADACQWRAIDNEFEDFGKKLRSGLV